jgi:hypothetical protein
VNARILLLVLLISPNLTYAQHSAELDKRNGFKDIKLGSIVDSVRGLVYRKDITTKDGQVLKIHTTEHPDYKKIGEVVVEEVELTSYNSMIHTIKVRTVKDLRLMKGMEMALGKAEWDVRNEQYVWKGTHLGLTFKSIDKNEIELTYMSFPVIQQMKNDLKKKVEEIADDF